MRVRLKGLNSVTKRLADGRTVSYYYAWKGGPPLRGEPGTPEFIHSYNEAIARKVTPPRGTLLSVLQQYQASEDFTGLAESTRHGYIGLVRRIEQAFGDFPLSALTDRRTRGVFMSWRDRYSVTPGAGRPTTPGPCWRWCWPGPRIAARSMSIPARRAGGCITALALILFGRSRMKPRF